MNDKELQEKINELEYNRIKLPKTHNMRIINYGIELTRQINLLRDLLETRRHSVK